MKVIRLAAEWAWERLGNSSLGEDPTYGYLHAGWYNHGNTGITCAKVEQESRILGWRFDTTVRSISHEVLFSLVITQEESNQHQVFTSWTHSAWRDEDQGRLPFSATKNGETVILGSEGILVPRNSCIWVFASGWGHWYGAPLPAHPTVMEFQGQLFMNNEAQISMAEHVDQIFEI